MKKLDLIVDEAFDEEAEENRIKNGVYFGTLRRKQKKDAGALETPVDSFMKTPKFESYDYD